MSGAPTACRDCLRRAWLIGGLAGHIERATEDAPGRRSPELLALSDRDLAMALAGRTASRHLESVRARDAAELRARATKAGAWACCRHDALYPSALVGWKQAPAVLFGRGAPALLERLDPEGTVTVVGSRRPSGYGNEMAAKLGRELGDAGLAVVSGMALGIDSKAHEGVLSGSGLTLAVLGSGPDVPHPRTRRRLYERIVERGLVLTELPPGARPWRWTFPARNRIMAALGRMTVVVEARRRSGSLITSEMAGELGREVGAVPGRVGTALAEGTNGLIRDGAHLVRGGQDVLDSLLGPGARRIDIPGPQLGADLRRVLEVVERGPGDPDSVARAGGLDPAFGAASLVRLELLGYLRSDSSGRYERTALVPPSVS